MLKVVITVLVVMRSFIGFAQTAEGIKFETGTWSEILAKAKKENKYVFVDAFTTWCGPCKWMEQNVFNQADVGAFFNEKFINAKIDVEKGDGIEIAKQYKVLQYPTFLYINGNGELVHRSVGAIRSPALIQISSDALDPEKQYVTLIKHFDNGERNPEFVYELAYMAQAARDMQKVQELAAEYLRSQSNLLDEKNVKFIGDFTTSTSDPTFEFMRKNASVFEASMGRGNYRYRMYDIVYQSSFQQIDVKDDATKEQALQYIATADQYFKNMLPEQAPKLSQAFAMNVYKTRKDWDNYAQHAIKYFEITTGNWYELNTVAWTFFENVNNPVYLEKAVQWAIQSTGEYENVGNTSTAANLYFKLGDKAHAKEYADKAISLGKATGEDTSSIEKLVQDIARD